MSERLRILCFGNPLHGDDGFGPTVAMALRRALLKGQVEVIDCGTRGLDALHWFENCPHVIVVDAMAGDQPGRLHRLAADSIPVESAGSGGHGAGVGYLLAAVRETIEAPPRIDVIAVEIGPVKTFAPGLSLEVAAAVAETTELIRTRWASASCAHSCELSGELDVLRQANQALESELIKSTEALELLIAEQERQQDELQLRSQELARLHGALERAIGTMAEIFVMLGPDGRVIRANRLLTKELGYAPEAVVGHYFEDCLCEADRQQLRRMLPVDRGGPLLLNAIRAADGRFEAELNFRRADAPAGDETGPLPYLVHASLIHSQAGKLEGAVVVASNIAMLKAREKALRDNERLLHETAEELRDHRDNLTAMVDAQTQDLRAAKEQAEAASQAKSEFLSNMSHEVRTPLTAVLGLSDLCLRTPLNIQQGQYLSKIRQAANHLLGIINDILDFSRIEAGKLEIEQVAFALPTLIDEITDLLIERIEDKGLELCVDIAPEVPASFVGDPLRLKQVIINLLGNAIKFSEKGVLTIGCKLESAINGVARLRFWVRDEGIGISPAEQTMLFSAFSQADTSTTRRYGGSGLGLVISRRLVELMNGRIWLDSQAGRGSTFHFTAGLQTAPNGTPPAAELADRLTAFAGRTVLVMDDNAQLAETLAKQVLQLGLQAEVCASGEEVLTLLTSPSANYLAALIDWQKPSGMSGVETITAIRQTLVQRAPALILLAPHNSSALPFMENNLADAVLHKPASLRGLYSALALPLHLPALPVSPPANNLPDISSVPHLHGADILVVDDVDLNRDLMQELLAMAGLKIRLASDGKQAITAIHQKRPDLVLMDCQMPIMDGFTATRLLRAEPQYADLPIIALTAGVLEHDRLLCVEAGMNAHITKPVDLDKLLRLISELLQPGTNVDIPVTPNAAPALEPAWMMNLPGIDVEKGLKLMGNKVNFYRTMLIKFRDSYGTHFETNLRTALANNQAADALRFAHTLKGMSRNLGMDDLGNLSATVEAELREAPDSEPPPTLEPLFAELARVSSVLAKLGQ
ncbi:MAG: hydrogenase maturation protease [Gammaproteobacteria bacterium]|nr:hydrogenase maturation protease [Gammaproteobacteria bacterium]MBU1601677.1 hydrogenase maturation protease [Gammaproteobacteria bacterium]MBU2434756.1 hydrogenase maturation protease [Gammaproteobacteria bacterium]MBU2447997.1 hydrogenase maturation protease [Gammaproteobacteria bacterium]